MVLVAIHICDCCMSLTITLQSGAFCPMSIAALSFSGRSFSNLFSKYAYIFSSSMLPATETTMESLVYVFFLYSVITGLVIFVSDVGVPMTELPKGLPLNTISMTLS